MNENISNISKQMSSFAKGLSQKTKKLIMIGVVLLIVLSAGIAIAMNNTPYELLFGGLTQEEASEIMGKLQETGVSYKYESDGIYVPRDDEPRLKASLISEGYPNSGFTYDVFSQNINMMSTDFEKQSYKLFELQSRMEATIRLFDGVNDAVVYITPPEDTKYVLSSDVKQTATASVAVTMNGGGSPTKEQAKGIQKLVAGGVSGMKAEDVTILDGSGAEVLVSEDESVSMARLKLEIQAEVENSIKSKVMYMLGDVYGQDKVRVSVNAVMDLDKKIKEIINYIPEGETGKGVVSGEDTTLEYATNGNLQGGVPGADSNADIPVYPGITVVGDEIFINDQKSADYLVSQVKEQIESDTGDIEDLTVSVVIDEDNIGDNEKAELERIVANIAGIEPQLAATKVAIINQNFAKEDGTLVLPEQVISLPLWMIIAIAVGVLIFVTLLMILAKKRKKKKAIAAMENNENNENNDLAPQDGFIESLQAITMTKDQQLKNQISDFTGSNPQIVAHMIKVWLKGEDGNV